MIPEKIKANRKQKKKNIKWHYVYDILWFLETAMKISQFLWFPVSCLSFAD